MDKEFFGETGRGEKATLYTLKSHSGLEVKITDYGATIVSVSLPDGDKKKDLVLGYDNVAAYEHGNCCFGATIGRCANRTRNAKVELDGISYQLEANENGKNNLHSSNENGYHKRLWKFVEQEEDLLTLRLDSPDMDQGFPGNLGICITFLVNDGNGLEIIYNAKADRTTVINLTNHSYFNLSGHDAGSIENEKLWVNADLFAPIDEESIPTGVLQSVDQTPMDFRKLKRIGTDIDASDRQIQQGAGYDHHFVLKEESAETLLFAALLVDEASGLKMELYTDSPGVQVYTGNWIQGEHGKDGAVYGRRSGIALETQYIPNAINEEQFDPPEFESGERFIHSTMYRFSRIG